MSPPINYTDYFILSGCPVSVILHGFGIFLLIKARKTNMDSTQRNIITSLSVSEFFSNIALMSSACLRMTGNERSTWMKASRFAVRIFLNAYYLNTLLLTVNRLLRIHLHILYPKYWSLKHTRYSVAIVWLISIAGSVGQYYDSYARVYTDVALDFLFILVAVITYSYAAKRSVEVSGNSRRLSVNPDALAVQKQKMFKGFLMSSMIVLSFISLQVIPHCTFMYVHVLDPQMHSLPLHLSLDCLLIMVYWSDALIYIFLSPHVRRLFVQTFTCATKSEVQQSVYHNQARRATQSSILDGKIHNVYNNKNLDSDTHV